MRDAATTVMERCEVLGGISGEPGVLTRPYGSRAMGEVNDVVSGWMREAGMTVRRDAIGNLIGHYEGSGEKTLILGSHLDTVRDAGKYDGILGVMVAIACVQGLHDRNERLPYTLEVVAFADEEGLRFGTTFLGSSVYAGAFDKKRLSLEDRDGVTLAEAVRAFGGDPETLERGREDGDLLGYCEVHIEQGPVLEELGLPVGVVSAINGQSRVGVAFSGKAAGTLCARRRSSSSRWSAPREESPAPSRRSARSPPFQARTTSSPARRCSRSTCATRTTQRGSACAITWRCALAR
jgi:allantoate deiminase